MINLYIEPQEISKADSSNPGFEFLLQHTQSNSQSYDDATHIISTKIPFGIDNPKAIQKTISQYQHLNKKIIIFLISDCSEKFNIPKNVRLLRTSLDPRKIGSREFLLPYVWEGFINGFTPLDEAQKIKVGFCGLNNYHRTGLLQALLNAPDIEANFIIREQFWGGAAHDPGLIKDFTDNLKANHLQACDRGRGNFSMRFYQTLSAGRIPLVSSIEMPLPFENLIKWDDVIIRGKSSNEVLEKVRALKDSGQIVRMQTECRKIYSEYFSPNEFFKNLLTRYDLN